MLASYSKSCERVLLFAQKEASQRRHRYIHTEYLLLGLLQDSNSATLILEDLGYSLGKLKRLCQAESSIGDHSPKGELRLTSRVRNIIERAESQKQAFDHPEVSETHLLLGILLEKEGVAGKVLRDCGVTYDAVRNALLAQDVPVSSNAKSRAKATHRSSKKSLWQFLSRA